MSTCASYVADAGGMVDILSYDVGLKEHEACGSQSGRAGPPGLPFELSERVFWRLQVRQVVETLRCCSHQAFPVTPDVKKAFDSAEPFELHGTILRHTVLHLLLHRIGFFDPVQADIPPSRSHIPTTQMVRAPISFLLCISSPWSVVFIFSQV